MFGGILSAVAGDSLCFVACFFADSSVDASQMLVAQCVYVLGAGLVCLVANVAILGGSSLRISR